MKFNAPCVQAVEPMSITNETKINVLLKYYRPAAYPIDKRQKTGDERR